MKIIADENMPLVEEFFGGWGEVIRIPGREISAHHVADASLLLVRSVTCVDWTLLSNSRVKFVGTATIGTDHIDQQWLANNNIGFSAAPGCNAEGVVQYVMSVLDLAAENQQRDLRSFRVGIVGAGNVGGRLYRCLDRLGVECFVCDPFLNDPALPLCAIDELIEKCDVVSLHTPLTRQGEHPTEHLFGSSRLSSLNAGCVFINSSRGAVVDNAALSRVLQERSDLFVALDVWENEPEIDLALLQRIDVATPHVAGYSLEGKLRGTAMVYEAACRYFNRASSVSLTALTPVPEVSDIRFSEKPEKDNVFAMCRMASRVLYDVRSDDLRMRHALKDAQSISSAFDALRRQYPVRRENSSLNVLFPADERSRNASDPASVNENESQIFVARGFVVGNCYE